MNKIAYLILAHMDPEHFSKLIKSLDKKECDIYVHIDQKVDISLFKVHTEKSNIYYLTKRISISWAGISMIDATNLLLRKVLEKKELYLHAILLSGSCYPIKKVEDINDLIMQNKNKEYIKFIDMRKSPEHYMKQITKKWFNEPLFQTNNTFISKIDRLCRIILTKLKIKNNWDSNIIPYFGSQFWALSLNCCEYLVQYQEDNPTYMEMNRYTFAPDEHYYHTIIGNSHFKGMAEGEQTFINRGTWRMANLHIIDASLTKWFTIEDWKEIKNSDKLFVRKVRTLDGSDLVQRINQEILK